MVSTQNVPATRYEQIVDITFVRDGSTDLRTAVTATESSLRNAGRVQSRSPLRSKVVVADDVRKNFSQPLTIEAHDESFQDDPVRNSGAAVETYQPTSREKALERISKAETGMPLPPVQ